MVSFMDSQGIDTSAITRHPTRSPGLYMIDQREGDRHFTYWRDNSAARTLADDADLLGKAVSDRDMLFFSGITLAILPFNGRETLLSVLANTDARVAFDPNIRDALWTDKATIQHAIKSAASVSDIILPSFDDEVRAFGDNSPHDTIERYQALGCQEIIVKDGANAVHFLADGERNSEAVSAVPAVIDATGAGDSFNGGYLAHRLTGHSVTRAVTAGISSPAQTIVHPGAIDATIP